MPDETKINLRDLICQCFDLSELNDLCFDLEIQYDNLQGQTLADKARELILYCSRRNLLSKLVNRCRVLRPNFAWPSIGPSSHKTSIETLPRSHPENILFRHWNKIDPDLQDVFTLAYNQARKEGRKIIKTRDVFAAMARLRPEPLTEFIRHLPSESLPSPVEIDISTEQQYLFNENPTFSGCVQDSLTHLSPRIPVHDKLSSADVFVDIAKFGTGSSVKRLRTHGIMPETVDEIVSQLGWQVISR